jgi:hypothetical protein
MQMIHTDKCGNFNRNCVEKLHCWSTTPHLRVYKTTKSFCLKQDDGSKQELKECHSEEHTYLCYLFTLDNLAREQCVWNVGWKDEEEGKQDKFKWLLKTMFRAIGLNF